MPDERQGKPSASGVERLQLCPGSWNAERGLPPLPRTGDSAFGDNVHAALNGEAVFLTEDEQDSFERCSRLESQALEQVFGPRKPFIARESRLWLAKRFSGKADLWAHDNKDIGLVWDHKTGRNEVAKADGNLQLRSLAVLHTRAYKIQRIIVGVGQPWSSEPISLAEYDRAGLVQAEQELLSILDAADKPDAPRIPGEKQCRWCRAKAVCPEAKGLALLRTSEVAKSTRSNDPKEIAVRLTGESLGWFLNDASFAESVITACRDEAKRRLKAGEEVPGWQLKDGATKEVIKDLETVHQRFIGYGGTTAQYLSCLSAAKGKLEDAMKEVTGYKGKELKGAFEALIQDCVEVKQNEPSLERVKVEKAISG